MALVVESVKYSGIWRGSADFTPYLLANRAQPVVINIDFKIEDIIFATEDNGITFAPPAMEVGTLDNMSLIRDDVGIRFLNFKVGDSITYHRASDNVESTFTIVEKINNGLIRIQVDFPSEMNLTPGDYLFLSTPFLGLKYFYNFIENSDPVTFVSPVDGETQMLKTNEADAANEVTPKILAFNGIKSYQIGSCILLGRGIENGAQKFRLTHITYLTPFFLPEELQDLTDGISPEYFKEGKCLRHVFRLEATETLNDPNPAQAATVDDLLANTGDEGENYNGGTNRFSITGETLKRVSDNQPIPGIQIDQASEYNFFIECTSPSIFQNGRTKLLATFMYLPEDTSQIADNGRDMVNNYVLDEAFVTSGAGAQSGSNIATPLQVITEFQVVFITSTKIAVRLRCDLGSLAEEIMSQGAFKRYKILIGVESYTGSFDTTDNVELRLDLNELFEDLEDTDIVNSDIVFIQHPGSTHADGSGVLNAFPVDDVAVSNIFNIDYTDPTSKLINRIVSSIVLKKPGELDITLDSFSINTTGSPLEGGTVPFINFDQDRVFKIPAGEVRKTVSAHRRNDLDSGNIKYWQLIFPFMHRWEYWKSLGILDNLPAGIFDPTEPLNGINHFWHRYTEITGWKIYSRVRYVLEIGGEEFEQVKDKQFSSMDFDSNPEWSNESIKSYTLADVEIVNGGTKYIQGFDFTKIVVSFEKILGDLPDVADVDIVIWIEPKEGGGIADIRRISSKYELDSQSWFQSIDSSNKVVKANPSTGVYTGTALIDNNKIPNINDFTIYARIYDPSPTTPEDGLITEQGDPIIEETSGDYFIVE